MVINNLKAKTIVPILRERIAEETKVLTDESGQNKYLHRDFAHDFVRHCKGEYSRGEIHTNTIEGIFSIFKRGMKAYIRTAPKSIYIAISPSSISAIMRV